MGPALVVQREVADFGRQKQVDKRNGGRKLLGDATRERDLEIRARSVGIVADQTSTGMSLTGISAIRGSGRSGLGPLT